MTAPAIPATFNLTTPAGDTGREAALMKRKHEPDRAKGNRQEGKMTERKPLIEWADPTGTGLDVLRFEGLGVVIVRDGQYSWAARLQDWDAESSRVVSYRESTHDDPISARAYADLCIAVDRVEADDPAVIEVCLQLGVGPEVLV